MIPSTVQALVFDGALVFSLVVIGWLLCTRIERELSSWFSLALAFPLGAGGIAWLLYLLSLVGVPVRSTTMWAVMGLSLVVLGLHRLASRSPMTRSTRRAAVDATPLAGWLPWVAIWGAALAAVCYSILRSYSTWDAAAIWGVKGYGIAEAGTIRAAAEWGAYGLSYPLNIPIQVSLFAMLDGDILPGSKLLFPMFYVSLGLAAVAYWRDLGVSKTWAAWGAAALLTIPVVFEHGTDAYANLPFAAYLFLGVGLAASAIERDRKARFALSGIALALGIWTRPEGLVLVAVLYLGLGIAARLSGFRLRPLGLWLAPAAVVSVLWIAVARTAFSAGILPLALEGLIASIRRGELHPGAFYWIGRYLARDGLRPAVWGGLPVIVLLGLVWHRRGFRDKGRIRQPLILAGALATTLPIFGFYYLVSFSGDLEWWLDTGLTRMLLPGGLLAATWALTPLVEEAGWGNVPEDDARPPENAGAR